MNNRPVHIAVDVMGGDFGPPVTLPAIITALSSFPSLQVTLLGRSNTYPASYRQSLKSFGDRVQWHECADEVNMNEKPSAVLRQKQESSLYQAVDMVRRGDAQGCVSAGSTGALMTTGCHLLRTFPGINRPAACAEIPTEKGICLMLDLGANVECSAEDLVQFAVMGSVMAKTQYVIPRPRVGLLNIGEEVLKGNDLVKQSAQLLQKNPNIHYIGYIEGDDIYEGKADVVVCDGFVGNAVLKASEGVARLITRKIHKAYQKGWQTRLLALLSRSVLTDLRQQMNPSRYNGATMLGLKSTVVVSHGKADAAGFFHAIKLAYQQVQAELPQSIERELNELSSIRSTMT